ncbi:epidermal growth factor-like type 3 [Stemphylium lycopersici]|nr:epidermal growth factor-like type 3 [Stemphylium lycopersici]
MSYDPRFGAGAYGATDADDGDARKGSVRAARERMQAAQKRTQLPDTSKIIGLPRRPNQLVSQYSQEKIEPSQQQALSAGRDDIESDSPSPQWPLPKMRIDGVEPTPDLPPRSPKRLQPPQLNVRPLSDEFPIQQLSPELPLSPGYLHPNDDRFSPSFFPSSRPITISSIASESSIGSIPDFPVPQPPMPNIQQARRFPSIGPPRSARRGPSSYYTQMSYVSPIVEESEIHSSAIQSQRGSFASSNVFPSNKDDFYPDDDPFSDDEETITSDRGTISPTEHDDRSGLVQQPPALVRQASLGRRTKPSLMTIKSMDSFGDKKGSSSRTRAEGLGAGVGAMGIGAATLAARDGTSSGRARSPLSREASSDSLSTMQTLKSKAGVSRTASPLQQELRPTTLAERAGMRRPARLDMDAVRDAEARGSLTSLPDLIRRATRLATNLDRGRTASRLGLEFWETGAPEKNNVRQSGLSEMLAAFPPPGQETPNRSGRGTPNFGSRNVSSGASSRLRYADGGNNEKPRQRRRCCGMPLWAFIVLIIFLLLAIAAAVVIPVVLIVIPNQNKANGNTAAQDTQGSNGNNDMTSTNAPTLPAPTADSGNGQCSGIITCQNGGVAIFNSDRSCNCVCINGFTGRTCTKDDATGCTTTSVAGTANNATMGSGIPRLIEDAGSNFNVPLDATRILSLFSTLSLSCAAENALITFNGLASRSVTRHLHSMDSRAALHPSRTLPDLHHPHPAHVPGQQVRRQAVGQSSEAESSTDQKSADSGTLITQPISSNVSALDLARIAVLLALQESSDLDVAANAQESIQTLLTDDRNGNTDSSTVDVGPFELDLVNFTIEFQNGTTIQAKPSYPPNNGNPSIGRTGPAVSPLQQRASTLYSMSEPHYSQLDLLIYAFSATAALISSWCILFLFRVIDIDGSAKFFERVAEYVESWFVHIRFHVGNLGFITGLIAWHLEYCTSLAVLGYLLPYLLTLVIYFKWLLLKQGPRWIARMAAAAWRLGVRHSTVPKRWIVQQAVDWYQERRNKKRIDKIFERRVCAISIGECLFPDLFIAILDNPTIFQFLKAVATDLTFFAWNLTMVLIKLRINSWMQIWSHTKDVFRVTAQIIFGLGGDDLSWAVWMGGFKFVLRCIRMVLDTISELIFMSLGAVWVLMLLIQAVYRRSIVYLNAESTERQPRGRKLQGYSAEVQAAYMETASYTWQDMALMYLKLKATLDDLAEVRLEIERVKRKHNMESLSAQNSRELGDKAVAYRRSLIVAISDINYLRLLNCSVLNAWHNTVLGKKPNALNAKHPYQPSQLEISPEADKDTGLHIRYKEHTRKNIHDVGKEYQISIENHAMDLAREPRRMSAIIRAKQKLAGNVPDGFDPFQKDHWIFSGVIPGMNIPPYSRTNNPFDISDKRPSPIVAPERFFGPQIEDFAAEGRLAQWGNEEAMKINIEPFGRDELRHFTTGMRFGATPLKTRRQLFPSSGMEVRGYAADPFPTGEPRERDFPVYKNFA